MGESGREWEREVDGCRVLQLDLLLQGATTEPDVFGLFAVVVGQGVLLGADCSVVLRELGKGCESLWVAY